MWSSGARSAESDRQGSRSEVVGQDAVRLAGGEATHRSSREVKNGEGAGSWTTTWVQSDGLSISLIVLLILGCSVHHRFFDDWIGSTDRLSFFIPMYSHLGDRLRAFDIPGWNPYVMSGAPFAGDPESGWMYFPAMVTFSFLSPSLAYKVMMVVQLLIASLSLYPLTRLLGLRPVAALVATILFTFGSFAFQHTGGATVATQLSAWLPLAFLGVELALRVRTWPRRTMCFFITGLAISQMLAGWPGQGSAYTLLMIAGWIAYRGLLDPFRSDSGWKRRILDSSVTGISVLGIGLAISAAALLPRLAVNAQSNNPGGTYEGVPGSVPGTPYPLWRLLRNNLSNDVSYRTVSISGVMLALAIIGVLVARRRHCAPFFIGLVGMIALLSVRPTIVHRLVYLLIPTFEELHIHDPKRIFWIAPLGPAILAGIAVEHLDGLRSFRRPRLWCWFPLMVVVVLEPFLNGANQWFGWETYGTVALVCGVVQLAVAPPGSFLRYVSSNRLLAFTTVALVVLSLWFPTGWDLARTRLLPYDHPDTIQAWNSTYEIQNGIEQNLSRTDVGGAGEFLQRQQEGLQPFRYTSYAGHGFPGEEEGEFIYTRFRPEVMGQLQNGRPIRLGLENTNGYNPLQIQNYVEYIEAMNGQEQNYHFSNLMPGGLQSPLLDMLGVRYIVMDASITPDRPDYALVSSGRREVFRNQWIVVFENARAFPRAWIVHSLRQNNDGEGLALLAAGQLDGRTTAVIDGPMPPIRQVGTVRGQTPQRTTESTVTVVARTPDSMTLRSESAKDGLMVISEIYEEGWVAYVDGESVDIVRTNHTFRGVPVTAGEHTVELRYESQPLTVGLWISGAALAGMFGSASWLAWSDRPRRRRRSWQVRGHPNGHVRGAPVSTPAGLARVNGYTDTGT